MLRMLAIVLVAVVFMDYRPAVAEEAAGQVDRIRGTATATRGAFSRPLYVGADVFVGDRVLTVANTRLRLRMMDGAVITLGDNSSITIEAYEQSQSTGRAALSLVEGAFLATSGAIAALGSDRFTLKTPSAVLGVRGTTLWGEQKPDHLAVLLIAGKAVEVRAPAGTVVLSKADDGTDVRAGKPPTEPKPWGAPRIAQSVGKVSFD